MSKKLEKNTSALPSIPYVNSNRLEEAQNKILQDKNFIDKVQEDIYKLKIELQTKDKQFMQSTKMYDKLLDDKSRELMRTDEELKKVKLEKKDLQEKLTEENEDKITLLKDNYENKIIKINDDLDKFREKHRKAKIVKKELKEDIESYKKELESINAAKQKQTLTYEAKLKEIEGLHKNEVSDLKRREEDFMKSNEELTDTDLYAVYKEIKKNCENQLSDLMNFKAKNDKITDENKLFKFNLDNSEKMIKQCSLVQVNQKKIITQLQEKLEEKTNLVQATRDELENNFTDMSMRFEDAIQQKENDLKRMNELVKAKLKENSQLKSLSQMILDQRSDIEMFFIESLEEVKMEIYKRKKEFEKRNKSFPNLTKKYEDKSKDKDSYKIDIKELTPEDRERVLRILFGKINENYQPKSYKNFNVRR